MKIKLSEATERQIDYLVATCEGEDYRSCREYDGIDAGDYPAHSYSTNWAQAGPIIEREQIRLDYGYLSGTLELGWEAKGWNAKAVAKGYTPLSAAMRCYVASKLGDEVDVPVELVA